MAGEPLFMRLYLSSAGSRLNLAGAPDVLIAAPERDANGTLHPDESVDVQGAGFHRTRDLGGYWLHRRLWPLEAIEPDDVARDIADRMGQTGLIAV
jgi:hypothetical protein